MEASVTAACARSAMVVGAGVTDPDAVAAALKSSADAKGDQKLYGAGIVRADASVFRTLRWHLGIRAAFAALGVAAGATAVASLAVPVCPTALANRACRRAGTH